jgi:ubiquinone/menaquinone biosynthesis C-methylase UbiE
MLLHQFWDKQRLSLVSSGVRRNIMTNPWLHIPATDYEAHMALAEVAQTQALNALFASALAEYSPSSIAVLGCTTGNGFEHIDTSQIKRVVGVDINAEYLAVLKSLFWDKIPCLKVVEADFTTSDFRIEPVSMVFAALVFEYVNVRDAVLSIERCMIPGGMLVAVLQLPSTKSAPVTATPYTSLEFLTPFMKLVSPDEFSSNCSSVDLLELKTDTVLLKMGKAFFAGYYRKDAESVAAGGSV